MSEGLIGVLCPCGKSMIVASSWDKAISVGASDPCPLVGELSSGTGVSTAGALCSPYGGETDALPPLSVPSEGLGTLAIDLARRERECQEYIPAALNYQGNRGAGHRELATAGHPST